MAAPDATRAAFVAAIEAHRGIVHKVVRAYCWAEQDREDLVQDILAQLWRAFPAYDAARPFSTWMYRIALNVAISWVRGHAPRHRATVPFELEIHDVGAEGLDAVSVERLRALLTAIRELAPLDRALVVLYLDDQSHRDIAAVLGISESNVATKLHRLRQRLRRRLESHT
jgi:RNA polymerase sigma factor (sigma-70 family)